MVVIGSGMLTCFASPADGSSGNDLLKRVVKNELQAEAKDHAHWEYLTQSKKSGEEIKKRVIQTKEGEMSAVLARNGQPLTAAQKKKQDRRIQSLVNDPDQLRERRHKQAHDAREAQHLLRILPQAVIADYEQRKGNLVELHFKPNPKFHPHSHEEEVFHGMEGDIWVDAKQDRLAQIDGRLIRNIDFWGGLLGHLDKGGQFQVKQSEVAPGYWEITLMHINMKGKALFFKTIGVHEDESRSDFKRVPNDLSLKQAAAELRQ